MPLKQANDLRNKLGWSAYQWTWHINHPEEWHLHTVIAWSHYTNIPLHVWQEDYNLGLNKQRAA